MRVCSTYTPSEREVFFEKIMVVEMESKIMESKIMELRGGIKVYYHYCSSAVTHWKCDHVRPETELCNKSYFTILCTCSTGHIQKHIRGRLTFKDQI